MIESLKSWWKQDAYRGWLLVGGIAYGLFMSQGVPLWDDDFTSWFWKIQDKSLFHYLFQLVSPISEQTSNWAFNERPIQAIVYKIFYLVSGYESWSYFLYKSCVLAGLGVMIYQWALRVTPQGEWGRRASLAAAVFLLLTPGPLAAHVLHQDLANTAELLFLILTYVIWGEIEGTPVSWAGNPNPANEAQRKWLIRWAILSFFVFLGYKSKADLKIIPVILAFYVAAVRRHQWRYFAVPVALMLFLAVPWGPGIFAKAPPFVPGSQGSEIGWMWQPASFSRMFEFIWAQGSYDFVESLRSSTISLAGLLGPFLLVGMLAYLFFFRLEAFDRVPWFTQAGPRDRARTFVLIWFVTILVGISALPAINYTFRIRYGVLHMVPASILLAWVFGLFAESVPKMPRWAVIGAISLLAVQSAINLNRSITYRRDMGQVMVAVDQVYDHVRRNHANDKLVLLPDFRPYDYRPDGGRAFLEKTWLENGRNEDLARFSAGSTYVISWRPSLWDQLELVEHFTGCRSSSLFDLVFPCPRGSGVALMRYIGSDPLYGQGEAARAAGKLDEARAVHEQYLRKYPGSLAAQFVIGLESYSLKDAPRAIQAWSTLEKYFPEHSSIVYNHALALAQDQKYGPAADRLKWLVSREPNNYAVAINLYYSYKNSGQDRRAKALLLDMKKAFPQDGEVNRLLTGT